MLKNSKVVLFLSPLKVGQAGNFWTLLRKFNSQKSSECYSGIKPKGKQCKKGRYAKCKSSVEEFFEETMGKQSNACTLYYNYRQFSSVRTSQLKCLVVKFAVQFLTDYRRLLIFCLQNITLNLYLQIYFISRGKHNRSRLENPIISSCVGK